MGVLGVGMITLLALIVDVGLVAAIVHKIAGNTKIGRLRTILLPILYGLFVLYVLDEGTGISRILDTVIVFGPLLFIVGALIYDYVMGKK